MRRQKKFEYTRDTKTNEWDYVATPATEKDTNWDVIVIVVIAIKFDILEI